MENEMPQRAFKGVWIPSEIWLLPDLSVTEKCLLAEISSLDDGDGCFASNDYFAKFFQLSKDRIAALLVSLRKKGLIKTASFDGKERRLAITFEVRDSLKKQTQPIVENNNNLLLKTTTPIVENNNTPLLKTTTIYNNIENRLEQSIENNPSYSPWEDAVKDESEEVKSVLREFYDARKQMGDPMTALALKKAVSTLNKLAKTDAEKIEIVNQSILYGWKGLFALKNKPAQEQSTATEQPKNLATCKEDVFRALGLM